MEKNRKILTDALRKLPVYSPKEKVWEELCVHLENKTSSAKLSQLIDFDPPESIWDNIEEKLSQKEKLSSLNEYNPPINVWENIEKNLSVKKAKRAKKHIVRWIKLSSAAAAIFLLGYFIFNTVNSNNNIFSYEEEWIELTDLQIWNKEEQSVEYALAIICNENPKVCKSPEFQEIDKELKFLDQSKQAIIQQLNKYDTNTELEILLTEIELERTSLIKEMISKTI